MKFYSNVESDADDAYLYDMIAKCKYDESGHDMQIVCYNIEKEKNTDKSNLINREIFKSTTGNATKQLRMRQKMRKSTNNAKTTEATLKQIVNQEFQAEKDNIEI